MAEQQVEQLTAAVQALTQRVYALERHVFPQPRPSVPLASGPQAGQPIWWQPPPPQQAAPARRPSFDLSTSRLLAIAGGLVLLLGLGYLLRYAVAQGWLGPGVRVLLALAGSAVLGAIGLRLERSPETRTVGQICVATATAGGYAAVVAAAIGYHLVGEGVGLVAAAVIAGIAAARGAWTGSQAIAALGIGGALAAPLLVQADRGGATLGFLVVALAAGLAVAVQREWPAITALAFVIVTPQLWVVADGPASLAVVLGLAGVTGGLFLAAATLHARDAGWAPAAVPALVLAGNALSTAMLGFMVLEEAFIGSSVRPGIWLVGLAVVHAAVAVVVSRGRVAAPIGIVGLVTAVMLGNAAVITLADGYTVAALLAALAAVLAAATSVQWLRTAVAAGLVVDLVVGLAHGLFSDVPQAVIGSAEALLLVAAASAIAVVLGMLSRPGGKPLVLAAVAAYIGIAVARLLSAEAPLSSLLNGARDTGVALLMCAVIVAALLLVAQLLDRGATVAAVVVANYGLSLAAVALDPDGIGRVALTGLWAVGGGVALVAGRRLGRRDIRRGGTALLGAAVAKAALVDTTLLRGTNRAVALLVCGSVLVATAVAEARAAGSAGLRTP